MKSFNIWKKIKFGITGITPFDPVAYFKRSARGRSLLANAAEKWRPNGNFTALPVDQPYSLRYLLVCLSPPGTAQPAGIPYTYPTNALVNLYPTLNRSFYPLGICTDDPGNGGLDFQPIQANVQMLGGGQHRSQVGITDSVVTYNTLLVPSATVAGELVGLPSTPGSYWSVGLSLSTSEGLGAQIEFDPRPAIISVGAVT